MSLELSGCIFFPFHPMSTPSLETKDVKEEGGGEGDGRGGGTGPSNSNKKYLNPPHLPLLPSFLPSFLLLHSKSTLVIYEM